MTRFSGYAPLLRARDIALVVRLRPFDTATREGRARERARRMMLTTVTSVGSRAASILVSLATVPLALRYLGTEQYGIWLVLISAVTWLAFVQMGVAPSLLNNLAAEGSADIRAVGLVATAWWLQVSLRDMGNGRMEGIIRL